MLLVEKVHVAENGIILLLYIISYMKLCAHFISEKGIFHISYVKIEVHISYMKVVEFSIFHIWKQRHIEK